MFCFVKEKFNRKKFLKGVDNTVVTVYTAVSYTHLTLPTNREV